MKLHRILFLSIIFISSYAYGAAPGVGNGMEHVRAKCGSLSQQFNHMKTMAGINTAITSVGTATGAGAIYAGFAKYRKDKLAEELQKKLTNVDKMSDAEFLQFLGGMAEYSRLKKELADTTAQSKNLGNWRTGLLATSGASNIAGAIIASQNKVDSDLNAMLMACRSALGELRREITVAHISGDSEYNARAQTVLDGCKDFEVLDISAINKRANGAQWSSVVGATTGVSGAIVSGIANSDRIRNENNADGSDSKKEKNLNTAANGLAIGTTVASGVATVFNATQIGAIRRAIAASEKCQGALK